MMTIKTLFEPIPDHLIATANATDLIDLIGQYSELHKKSVGEYCGPCPKCGGNDRLVVQSDKFFCRQCHDGKWHDAIAFESWISGCDFRQAVSNLTGAELIGTEPATRERPLRRAAATKPARSSTWDAGAKARQLAVMQENLFSEVGAPARAYLENRALEPHIWLVYGLGFNPNANGKGPAISIPWYKAGNLVAIRYRFIEMIDGQKLSSEVGSTYSGILFGGQALPAFVTMLPDEGRKNGEHYRTLILCEGEINAMSLYQVAHETGVDVLSVGSEAASIPQGIISIAGRYGAVFTWFDRAGRAAEAARVLAGAHAISVPNGQDANDLLQAGRLGGFLVANRLRACGNDVEQLNRIKWGLWDAAQMPMGIDDLSAEMLAGMV